MTMLLAELVQVNLQANNIADYSTQKLQELHSTNGG